MGGSVTSVSRSGGHTFSKPSQGSIRLLAGLGVEGDAHLGEKVKHRSRVARDPAQPNLRQVHLIPTEIYDEVTAKGFAVRPGEMGENITTSGIDLLHLPVGTRLQLGADAVIEITGLRTPCGQLNGVAEGLRNALLVCDDDGNILERKAGVMAVVVAGGEVRAGDAIGVELPAEPHRALEPV